MRTIFRLLGLAFLLAAQHASAVNHAILIQNSGWMEPFYTDASSQFKPLVAAVAETVAAPSDHLLLLAFNQSSGANVSPSLVFDSKAGAQGMRTAIDGIRPAFKRPGQALADTDFQEAVFKTITGPLRNRSAILWIFTNNRNSPNNSTQTADKNREFYRLIHREPSIRRSLAFPLSMPVRGRAYTASGVMVYALAYGEEADKALQQIVSGRRLAKVLTQQPAQLKPLDRDSVRMVPKAVVNSPDTSASLDRDGRTLLLDIDASSRRTSVQITAAVENMFYPFTINEARMSANLVGKTWSRPLQLSPRTVSTLAPGASTAVTVTLPIAVEYPDPWSPSALLEFGRELVIPAKLVLKLDEQKLTVDQDFAGRLAKIFPGDPLPEVFVPPESAAASMVELPLHIRVHYPVYPLLIAITACLLLAGLLVFLSQRKGNPRAYEIRVNGIPRRVSVATFAQVPIFNQDGKQIATITRRSGAPTVASVADGNVVEVI